MLNALSIRWRFTLLAGVCLTLVAGVVLISNLFQSEAGSRLIAQSSERMLTSEVKGNLLSKASQKGEELKSLFGGALTLAKSLSTQTLEARQSFQAGGVSNGVLRSHLTNTIKATLDANPWALGVFIIFDRNALDNNDQAFKGDLAAGANDSGRYGTYWSRFTGVPKHTPITESDLANSEIQENGAPYNSWFMCSRTSGHDCILSPYSDEEAGHWVLMTTITTPIVVDGKTIGVVGIDISLESLQNNAILTQKSLFSGNGKVTIFSNSGVIAANSNAGQSLGKRLDFDKGLDAKSLLSGINNSSAEVIESRDSILGVDYVKPIDGDISWGVVIQVPRSVLLASVNELQQELGDQQGKAIFNSVIYALIAVSIGLLLIWYSAGRVTSSISLTARMLREIASGDGDLTQRVKYGRRDELGDLISWFNKFLEKLQPTIAQVIANTQKSNLVAEESSLIARSINDGMQIQFREVELVATASNEMSASSHEVAINAGYAAQAAKDADLAASEGAEVVLTSNNQMDSFARSMANAVTEVERLGESSDQIGTVLDVIRGVAEQTNLLALNAAIEAARAGDTGRGFAVVADEVRNLARRTQDSVEEIRLVIESLQQSARKVVTTMHDNQRDALLTGANIAKAADSLSGIRQAISVISDMNMQIAAAAEEQSAVAEEVSRNVSAIKQVSQGLTEKSDEAAGLSQSLNALAGRQLALASQFKV